MNLRAKPPLFPSTSRGVGGCTDSKKAARSGAPFWLIVALLLCVSAVCVSAFAAPAAAPALGGVAPFGEGTIWTAAQDGNLGLVKRLLGQNPKLANARFVVGRGTPEPVDWTPLSLAAVAGKVEVAKFLLSKGATVNLRRGNGNTPLYDVVLWGGGSKNRLEVLSLLLSKGANVNERTRAGFIPLDYARDAPVARLLLDLGAKINDYANVHGITPLQSVVKYSLPELSRTGKLPQGLSLIRLLALHHADLRHKDKAGKSALDYARGLRDTAARQKVSTLLLSLGAK